MRIYLPRFFVRGVTENLANFSDCVDKAADLAASVVVFPEQFITGYRASADPERLHESFSAASTRHPDLLICCGTITEDRRNQQHWYKSGGLVATYSKVHLFEPNAEHELWEPGNRFVALNAMGLRIGLGTCNDVRFPGQMLELSRHGKLDLLIYPALWPWERDHVWRKLLQARAIEHCAFAVGCCVAGVENGLESFAGAGNYVFDPLGGQVHADACIYSLDHALLRRGLVDTSRWSNEQCQSIILDC